MTDYQKYINALRKCANEHEGDRTFTGQIIVSDLCRDTADLLEELEQEPFINKPCVSSGVCEHDKNKVLEKIRAEIEELPIAFTSSFEMKQDCLDILDKYKAEIEPQESEDI